MNQPIEKTAADFTAFYYAKVDDVEKRAELKDLYVRHADFPFQKSCPPDLSFLDRGLYDDLGG